jgi:hypothetical protein
MRVYHFVNAKYGLENIRRRRLKIATINELNDPFELFGVDLSEPSLRDAFKVMKNELSKKRGLLCFSRSWHNPVQWSHYADTHKGICLGFDVPDKNLCNVHYSRKRILADVDAFKKPEQIDINVAKKFLFTKYEHWKYEMEVRSFVTLEEIDELKQLYFAEFSDKIKLKEVIVGAQSEITRQEVSEALGNLESSVIARKVRLAFKSFKVVHQKNENLWA